MNTIVEQRYYSNLWNIIRTKSKDFNFYRLNARGSAELDTSLLARYTLTNYPNVMRASVSDTIYQLPNVPFSDTISRIMLNNSSKGFSLALKEKDRKHKIMVNAGTGPGVNKKRTIIVNVNTIQDTAELRSVVALQVIKSDIEYVLQKQLGLKVNKPLAAIFASESRNTVTPKGNFEQHFKALMKEQGAGASPMATAQYLFTTMPHTEKRKLNVSLNAMGIKSNNDMEHLLHKWTAEALKGIHTVVVSKAKSNELAYER
jgi:hypothetical protein